MPNSGSHLFAISSSPSAWEMSINGISQGVANANYNPGGALVIGNGSSGAGLKGDIAEVILYNRVLTAAEANQVGAYLENKYGLDTAYVSGGYGTWAGANAGGQTPGENYDNDGVANGIEYFMGATGSSFTANPGLDGTNTVAWPKSATFSGSWQVQTSPDLSTWTNVAGTDNGSSVSYTLPPGEGKKFVRLLVTPTP
jgi:hypothetical protein